MNIIVEDTNILIDLYNTGLIRFCHLMGFEFHTTGYVIGEIGDQAQLSTVLGYINNNFLIVDNFSGNEFVELTEMQQEFKGKNNLSEADCSVILLAEKHKCRLLTADQKLKKQAEARSVEVHGFLWLTDRMVEQGVVEQLDMANHLQRYKDTNPRAPEPETSERIMNYKHIKI